MVILEKDRQLVESGLKVSLLPAKYTANKIANEVGDPTYLKHCQFYS